VPAGEKGEMKRRQVKYEMGGGTEKNFPMKRLTKGENTRQKTKRDKDSENGIREDEESNTVKKGLKRKKPRFQEKGGNYRDRKLL